MSEVPEKRVLAQDLPQYQQSQRARTIAQQKEAEAQYQREVAEIEKQNLSEQQRYEAELEAYKKATQKQREADALKVEYDTEIRKLEEEKADAIARAHSSVWGPGGSRNRSDLNTKLNKIEKQYDNKINKVREQKRVTSGVAEYYLQNPESKLDTSVLRRFQETGSSFNLGILQSQKDVAREARTEYSRQAGVTTARSEAGKIQSAMAGIGTTQGSYGLGEGSERAAAVRPTPDTTAGKKAVESRRPLINVKTVENIYGGQQIETNPRAFVASLTRQDVSSSTGKPTEPQTIFSFQNITDVKEESGRALLEFQSQLKTRTAPSATVYKGILEERGLPLTPLSKRIIDTYSSKGLYRDYKEPTAAKGKKGIVSKDGEKIFDIGTGMGDVRIGKEFGFVYDYNLQRPTTEQPKIFEGTLQYALSPKVQGPPKPRYEEVVAVPGSLEYVVQNQPGKPTSFNKLLESSYKSVDEFQSSLQKNYPVISAVGPSQALEAIKIGVATTGFIVSGTEQYVDPFVQDKLGLKRTARPAPLVLGETSDEVLLPVDIGRSFESKAIVPKEKYFEGIYEYGKKYGAGSLVVGGYTYWQGKGALQVPRKGLELVGIAGQRQRLLLRGSEELQTVYSGVTFRNRPIFGIQEGRLRFGIDYSKIPYEKIDIENPVYVRSGMEAALGSGIEKFIFYSRPALKAQREKGIISELSEQRALEVAKGTEMGMKTKSKVGSFADVPFENLSKRQSDYLFRTTTQLQKQKKVEAVHGSVALGAQVPEPIKPAIKFGDIDIVPTIPTVENANKLIERIARNFPLEKGQTIKTVKPTSETANRQLLLFTEGKKEPEKILEVVLKGDEKLPSGESIVTKGTNILGFKIPFGKSVKEKSFGLKVHTANYQLLTNVKQAISYQKGKGDELLDIYPSSGRVKDVARTYLNLKAKAIFQGGKKGEALDIQAEKIKSLYDIDFGDIGAEKIVLSSSPPKAVSVVNKITPKVIPTATIKTEPRETTPSVKIVESKISVRPSRTYSYRPTVSIAPSRIQSLKPSRVSSIRPSSIQTSRITTSQRPSVRPSRTTYRIRVPRIPPTRSRITKTPPTSRFYTPPSRITSPPPSRIPASYRLTPPPSRITSPPPSRIPASYRLTPPPQTTITVPPTRRVSPLLTTEGKIPKSVLKKQKERADFLGASSELQIGGLFKRADITYGQRKISKLLKGDVRVVQGKKRASPRRATKWTEGKTGDMFGFKNEAKKKSKNKTRFW